MRTTRSLWRVAAAIPVIALGATGVGTIGASVASASPATVVTCGSVITASTTLHANVGPCNPTNDPSGNGITLAANGITLNLNGFTVSGAVACCEPPVPPATVGTKNFPFSADNAGIFIDGVNGTTVKNGNVTGFQAGVLIDGGPTCQLDAATTCKLGEFNLVTKVDSYGNIGTSTSNYGDGIAVDNGATYNTISNNYVSGNGPYDGIGMVASASNNTVTHNIIVNNNVVQYSGTTGAASSSVNFGIRDEGPSALNNQFTYNTITGSGTNGIGDLPVCPDAFSTKLCLGVVGNTPLLISHNTLNGNIIDGVNIFGMGLANAYQPNDVTLIDNTADYNGQDGINLQGVGCNSPSTLFCGSNNITMTSNTTNYNTRNGITVGEGTTNSTIDGNIAQHNAVDGIDAAIGAGTNGIDAGGNTFTGNTASHNGSFDGFDGNLPCGGDVWTSNVLFTVNQPCV